MSFVHLHAHTEYSLLSGAVRIKEYIQKIKASGMNSAAITDSGVMYGVIDFYKEATVNDIKAILGCEIRLGRKDVHTEKPDVDNTLVLLAENNRGYTNLVKIVSNGFINGLHDNPVVDKAILKKYSEGIIALSSGINGEIEQCLLRNDYELAKKAALEYADIFGKNSFFLEMQNHSLAEEQKINQYLMALSKETGIELVATNNVYYIEKEDYKVQEILLCIKNKDRLDDENREKYKDGEYYLRSEEEMLSLFPYAKKAVENTQKIADRCNVEIKFHERKLPKFPLNDGIDSFDYLKNLCEKGLKQRYEDITPLIEQRLDFELATIKNMGFVDYFLIVWDFIKYAKDNDISIGPRGSAAGSIVSYCLHITDIDPLKYNLMFERFLNPYRVSMPDIDIDICDYGRRELIEYVIGKYGSDRVVQIITFGTLAPRQAIRDVARVMNFSEAQIDRVSKMVPQEKNITIEKAVKSNTELSFLVKSDRKIADVIEMAKRIEGLPRHTSIHAAGVVICKESADELIPLARAADSSIVTQFTMTTLEELGLLKMDFLGLKALSVIHNTGKMAGIDIEKIDFNDENVYKMIASGSTDGIFQLESKGMRDFMQKLKPTCFEDIVAGLSLFRPGPMDFIPKYCAAKNNNEQITYHCKELEEILKPTYGCIVYQEQVMQIAQTLAGYSLGKSDILRRAMSKKKVDVMNKERHTFVYGNESEGISGCIKNGIDEKTANIIFDEIMEFANYAFNKSHSVAYALLAYRSAFLKYYYKTEFMAAKLSTVLNDVDKLTRYLYTCKEMNIRVIPPDINISGCGFRVKNDSIVYALDSIKGIGTHVAGRIENERVSDGEYESLYDFILRNKKNSISKGAVENLIKAGAFDKLEVNRRTMIVGFKELMDEADSNSSDLITGQGSIFDLLEKKDVPDNSVGRLKTVDEFDMDMLLGFEKEVLGLFISGHPIDEYSAVIKKNATNIAMDFAGNEDDENNETPLKNSQKVVVGGIIKNTKPHIDKNGRNMAFATLEDMSGEVELIIFSDVFEKFYNLIYDNEKVLVLGKVSTGGENRAKIIVSSIMSLNKVPKRVFVRFDTMSKYFEKKAMLDEIISISIDGTDELIAFIADERKMKILTRTFNSDSDVLLKKLHSCFKDLDIETHYKKVW